MGIPEPASPQAGGKVEATRAKIPRKAANRGQRRRPALPPSLVVHAPASAWQACRAVVTSQ